MIPFFLEIRKVLEWEELACTIVVDEAGTELSVFKERVDLEKGLQKWTSWG